MRRVVMLAVLVGACGEAGEPGPEAGTADAGPVSPPDAATPPPGPLRVEGSTPEPGATRVSDAIEVQVRFSELLGERVEVEAWVEGATSTAAVEVEGASLEVRWPERLPGLSEVRIEVSADTESADGVPLGEAYTLSFQVGGATPIAPRLSDLATTPLDCTNAWSAPPEFDEGLSTLGWTRQNLHSNVAWSVPVEAATRWINDRPQASGVRVRADEVPVAGRCFVDALRSESAAGVLSVQAAFGDPVLAFNALEVPSPSAGSYPEDEELEFPVTSAVWGLFAREEAPFDAGLRAELEALDAGLPASTALALADALHAIGEADALKNAAFGERASEFEALRTGVLTASYDRSTEWVVEPRAPLAPLRQDRLLDAFEPGALSRSAARLADAAQTLSDQLAQLPPGLGEIAFDTPYGQVILHLEVENDAHELADDVALFVDAGGDDAYLGHVAATVVPRVSASLVIDAGGNDTYGPEFLEPATGRVGRFDALSPLYGFTQGFGLLGAAVLYDAGGDDVYRGSMMVQGAGFLGVGALIDRSGADIYHSTFFAQGAAQFGTGLLFDRLGDDQYTTFHNGQGVGRPRGQGLLLDAAGDDDYVAAYVRHEPELPENSPLFYPSGYEDSEGTMHNLSASQGTGWGLRFDWFTPESAPDRVVWAGGLGALVDFGDGADIHFADTLSIGQGFVYGMGLSYDGGGDDLYRGFWWGFGSGTHMGAGLFIEDGGDDDVLISRFSAALGHDTGISWYLDNAGADLYGGNLTFGRSLDDGQAFFIDSAGDDTYAPLFRVNFGVCHRQALPNLQRVGAFLDLGGGNDIYLGPNTAPANDSEWFQAPEGDGVSIQFKKGMGIDR